MRPDHKAARNAAIVAAFASGEPGPSIAKRYGVSRQRIHQVLHDAGIGRSQGGASFRTRQRDEAAERARQVRREARTMQRYGVRSLAPYDPALVRSLVQFRRNFPDARLTLPQWVTLWAGVKPGQGNSWACRRIDPTQARTADNLKVRQASTSSSSGQSCGRQR